MTFSFISAAYLGLAFCLGYLIRERLAAPNRQAHRLAERMNEQRLDLVL